MKIEFDFRADITVCELIQYLSDELEDMARITDRAMKSGAEHWRIAPLLERENRTLELIEDICLKANHVDRQGDNYD